jgi:hypothetical protein
MTPFSRDGQFALFDALASAFRRKTASPGPHAQTHPDDEASWLGFIEFKTPPTDDRPSLETTRGLRQQGLQRLADQVPTGLQAPRSVERRPAGTGEMVPRSFPPA